MAYDIFISYRREDGKEIARQLQLKLQMFGYKAFLDVEELKDGVFDQRIIDAIESSKVFLAVLTPRYLSRCANENDWVRKEIECASKNNIHIVPINLDKNFTEFPDDCPFSIRNEIGQHQFTEVFTGQQFSTTMNYLDEYRLRPYIVKVEQQKEKEREEGAIIHIEADADCKIVIFGREVCSVKAGEDKSIRLLQGNKNVKAISQKNPNDYIEFKYNVPSNSCEEIMTVNLQPIIAARVEEERRLEEAEHRKRKEVIEHIKKRVEEEHRKRIEVEKAAEEAKIIAEQRRKKKRRSAILILLASIIITILLIVIFAKMYAANSAYSSYMGRNWDNLSMDECRERISQAEEIRGLSFLSSSNEEKLLLQEEFLLQRINELEETQQLKAEPQKKSSKTVVAKVKDEEPKQTVEQQPKIELQSQESENDIKAEDAKQVSDNGNEIFTTVEKMPIFPEGHVALRERTTVIRETAAQETVEMRCVIEKDGSIGNVEYLSGEPSLKTEAANIIKSLSKFQPGMRNGSPARVSIIIPVTFKSMYEYHNGHAYVDLGLSVKWATCNVGANSPSDFGDHYAYGEVKPKSEFSWENYKYGKSSSTLRKYNSNKINGIVDNKTVLDVSDDVAHINWGGTWRIPSKYELEELYLKCTWEWTTRDGVPGFKVISNKNGNYIFLPGAGMISHQRRNDPYGNYISNTIADDNLNVWKLGFNPSQNGARGCNTYGRMRGYSVRPVCE